MILFLIIISLTALFSANWSYFKILRMAKEKNLVDNPDARKLQKEPVPVMGGMVVFIGVMAGLLCASAYYTMIGNTPTAYLLPAVLAMVIMLFTGMLDDTIGLTPRSRFVIEILTILGIILAYLKCIDSMHGIWGIETFSWYIAIPFTIFAGVGIINAINMIDGVNGLASGLSITYCCIFGIAFTWIEDWSNAALAFILAASLIPFFIHNVFGNSSRMFIGDAGTMTLGVTMVWFVISLLSGSNQSAYQLASPHINMVAFCMAALSVPLFDTVRVMTMRLCQRKSPFHPDKTHLHHAFIKVGISHSITTLVEICINALVVLLWSISADMHFSIDAQLYTVIGSGIILVWGTYAFLQYHVKHHTHFLHWITHFSIKTHMGRTKWWKKITAWLDAPESRILQKLEQEQQEAQKKTTQQQANNQRFTPPRHTTDHKEIDRKTLTDYLKGKAEVYVQDLQAHAGVTPQNLDILLKEEIQNGYIKVIRTTASGDLEIVAAKD